MSGEPAGQEPLAFQHVQAQPASGAAVAVLFLFHGTGGDETSLLELGRALAPRHLLVGVRGRSDEEGVTRFFRRFDALHYDQDHLRSEATALATFTGAWAERHRVAELPRHALGYSNGANVALAAELLAPATFRRLALLRPVQPFSEPPPADLSGLEALLLFGAADPYLEAGRSLPGTLEASGAQVEHAVLPAGHDLTYADVERLTAWFAATSS